MSTRLAWNLFQSIVLALIGYAAGDAYGHGRRLWTVILSILGGLLLNLMWAELRQADRDEEDHALSVRNRAGYHPPRR